MRSPGHYSGLYDSLRIQPSVQDICNQRFYIYSEATVRARLRYGGTAGTKALIRHAGLNTITTNVSISEVLLLIRPGPSPSTDVHLI